MNFNEEIKRKLSELNSEGKVLNIERKKIELKAFIRRFCKIEDNEKVEKKVEMGDTVILDDKVDMFIKWYTDNIIKGNYTDIGEYYLPIDMRNFIEKVAVWYELRYPEYEINRIMPGWGQEKKEVSQVMFSRNPYINELFDEDADIRCLDWSDFYNTKSFISSLPDVERSYFIRPKYKEIVYWDKCSSVHLHLSNNGYVEMAEYMTCVMPISSSKEIEGMHIKEVVKMLKEKDITLPDGNEFETAINNYERSWYCKEEMLNCIMYRIIERGGNRVGPRRAFLFAKEFGRNIDIPMIYGIDYSDPGLRKFINEYLKLGGSKELTCYVDYFSRPCKYEKFKTVSISEVLKRDNNYTSEEKEMYKRLVNTLYSQVDQEKLRKEEVRQARIERKIAKAKVSKKIKD